MHSHDIELIMALAEGSLDPAAADAAAAEIAACAECSLDLEMQTSVVASLHALPAAQLTEMESARLRRNVRNELGIAKEVHVEPRRQRRRMPLAALGTAAAVLLAVVVAAPALNLIGGTDDDSSDAPIAVGAESATTTAASFQLDATENTEDLQGNGLGEAPPAAESTLAPTTTTTATTRALTEDPTLYAYFARTTDLGALLNTVAATGFDEDASRSQVLRVSGESIVEQKLADSQACSSITISSSDNFIEAFQIARGQLEDRAVLYIVYLAEDLEESALIVHAADNCEELGRAGP